MLTGKNERIITAQMNFFRNSSLPRVFFHGGRQHALSLVSCFSNAQPLVGGISATATCISNLPLGLNQQIMQGTYCCAKHSHARAFPLCQRMGVVLRKSQLVPPIHWDWDGYGTINMFNFYVRPASIPIARAAEKLADGAPRLRPC